MGCRKVKISGVFCKRFYRYLHTYPHQQRLVVGMTCQRSKPSNDTTRKELIHGKLEPMIMVIPEPAMKEVSQIMNIGQSACRNDESHMHTTA